MAYTSNVPQAGQQVSQSQSLIQANFMALSSFGNGYAILTNQVTAPSAGTIGAGNDCLYTLNYSGTSVNELFVHRQSIDAPTDVPFTASILSNTAMASSSNGWTYLPSGILLKWGAVAAPGATVAITPTVTSGGPTFNSIFRGMLTAFDSSTNTNFTCGQRTAFTSGSGNFTAYCANPSGTTVISYLLIGV